MSSVKIGELVDRFGLIKEMDMPNIARLFDAFGSIEDTEDSALKILIPLLLAYSDRDHDYGKENDKLIQVTLTEDSRVKITLNIPIIMDSIEPNINPGIFCGNGVNIPI